LKKILYIQKSNVFAGSENFLYNFIPEMSRRGFLCDLIIIHKAHESTQLQILFDKMQQAGVHVIPVIIYMPGGVDAIFKIKKIINTHNYDIIHSNLIHSDFYCYCIKKLFLPRLKIVSMKHGYDEPFTNQYGFDINKIKWHQLYYQLSRWMESIFNASIYVSHGLYQFFQKAAIANKYNNYVVHHGILSKKSSDEKSEYRLAPLQLCIAGRLVAFKGHEYALNALPKILEAYPNLILIIVGDGYMLDKLLFLVHKLSIDKNVLFIGFTSDVLSYMQASDIILIPSNSEGFGIVALEAMSLKKPIVAFDVPAINEIVINNQSGFLCPPFDIESFASRVIELLDDAIRRQQFGECGYNRLSTDFNFATMCDKINKIYDSILNL